MPRDEAPPTPRPPPPGAKPRLLIVEDDADTRHVIELLARSFFHVIAVGDGAVAADLAMHESFDVILTDVSLPGMSGIDLLRIVRVYDLDVPVVVMTGEGTEETRHEAIELGALMYVEKPFHVGALLEALSRASKLSRLARVRRDVARLAVSGSPLPNDQAGLEACFDRALVGIWMADRKSVV